MADSENFLKFIIKLIVKVVHIQSNLDVNAPFAKWYRFEKVELDDDIMRTIKAEGLRYGLTEEQCGVCIAQADSIINFQPQVQTIYVCVDVDTIKNGQHVRFVFNNDSFGILNLDVIKDGKHKFIVVRSDAASLIWADEIYFSVNRLNIGFSPSLCVLRNGLAFPGDTNCTLVLGRLLKIELFSPGITHEIIDSESDFRFVQESDGANKKTARTSSPKIQNSVMTERQVEKSSKSSIQTSTNIKNYLWLPSRFTPISFAFTNNDANIPTPDYPPFLAVRKDIMDKKAVLIINPSFVSHLSKSEKLSESLKYLVDTLENVCEVMQSQVVVEAVKKIDMIESGILEYSEKKELWIMKKPPRIVIS
ncbi:hypothetical protein [Bacteroides thetaiotaomicron]|uniref:hypothetical protein n=1 Tax=Bacteroides thetaiotaomicron TaxID=818 RepID=UPI0035629ED0